MERFAIKIDKNLKANLCKICRLCGIDNPDKVKILDDETIVNLEEGEPELWKKVLDCIGLLITKDDKMPQFMCTLCVDKINDFFEFREMCYATDIQTRKLLGIKEEPKIKLPGKTSLTECKVEAQDVKQAIAVVSAQKPGRKRRNADMEICSTLKDIKTDDIKDVKPATASPSLTSAKKKRLKLESTDIIVHPGTETKTEVHAKTAASKPGPASKIGLAKKRLKMEPNPKDKKDLKAVKVSKLLKGNLKTEPPSTTEDRRSTPFQLKKKKAIELLKQRKLAKQVAVVKVEKLRKASIDAKIKEETPRPVPLSGANQPKVKLKEACTICSDSYVNKTLLDKHIKATHIPTIARYHCVHCNETLKKNMEIKNHNLWHKLSKTPFQCGNCSETSCSIYTYSKHIRDCGQLSYIDAQIPDWHCPDCRGVFETTYLFNIHSCVSNTLVCPGCDRSHKWKEDYFKHIPTCAAAVHRIPSYMTPNIQVKNEAEHPNSPIPQNHAHVLHTAAATPAAQPAQPSRITPPLMDSNQCVVIPGNVSLHEEAASPSPKDSCKKSKRITKKDLKRFDKLLKSTMTTLVSIKQEPALCEGSGDREQSGSVDIRASSESPSASPEPADDHFYNDDDESADEQSFPQAVGSIKQEIVDEGYRDLYSNIEVNVKREIPDNDTRNIEAKRKGGDTSETSLHVDSQPPKPVLKLKITKEHGTLNSILLDSPKSEKKKKKKKRKEEKHRDREDGENIPRGSTKDKAAVNLTETPVIEPTMPLPGLVRVKKEIAETEEEKEKPIEQFPSDTAHCVPSIVAATSGSLQISCVSEGVNFNGAEENEDQTEQDPTEDISPEMEATTLCSESQDPVDIKPRLEDLIPMPTLQIASVSSAEDIIKPTVKRKRGRPPGSTKASTSTPKILSVSSGSDVHFESELRIASKSGDVDSNENVFDYTQVKVKEEVVDPAFDEQDNEVPQKEVEDEVGEVETENPTCNKQAEENAYIANIDFNNLSIKQEKEYIDDGLDNPLGFEDDDDSESDSDSSSDSDSDDSESEREYRELPSENEENTPNATSSTVAPAVGLQIVDVRSEYTCLHANEKTESENGAECGSENKTESNTATECRNVDTPTPSSDQSAEGDNSCRKDEKSNTSSVRHEENEDSLLSLDLTEGRFCLLNSENDNQAASVEGKENECRLLEPSTIFNNPSTAGDSATNALLLDEVDCEANEVAISKDMHAIDSLSQRFDAKNEINKSLTEQLGTSVESLVAHPSHLFAKKEDDLKTSGLSDIVQTNLLPISIMDHLSPAEVNFTVMPVEITQTDHSIRPSVEHSAAGTSTSEGEDNKSPEQSPYCSLTQAVDVPAIADSSPEAEHFEDPNPEIESTETSIVESVDHINLLDSPFSRVGGVDLGNDNELNVTKTEGPTKCTSTPELVCQPSRSSMSSNISEASAPKESSTTSTLQLSPPKMFYHTSGTFGTTSSCSVQSIVDGQELSSNEEINHSTDENFPQVDVIGADHLEQQRILMGPPVADSLTLHLPSSFGETQPATSDIFNATIGLDAHFSTELERQDLDSNVSIDLCDVLSNSTLQVPTAMAVLSPHSNSNFSQSSCNVNDTSGNIPYSSSLQHLSSDTNFIESSLNFTELCRNNSSLGNLSDFHINTSTAGHLHNLISTIDAHPPQLIPELSEMTSSSTNNTDLNVPVLSEEVQNLLNEDTVAASNFELNDSILRARCSSSINAFSPPAPVAVSVPNFTDLENVNEIAENNNNANIERELQDELGNALAAAIADRSPNDDVDENNVINENRANFDLT